MEHPSEHVEHIEHQEHAAHNPFDKKVAMTMAVVAAALAAMTMLSHQAHNATLNYLSEAGILQTKASIMQTRTANQWSYYQAKNIRSHNYKAQIVLLDQMTSEPSEESKKARKYWADQVKKYEKELPEMEKEARALDAQVMQILEKDVEAEKAKSHEAHLKAARFDMGELGIELALIFCSLAVLTKRKAFWYSGLVVGIVGLAVGLSGYLVHGSHGHADDDHGKHTPAATQTEHGKPGSTEHGKTPGH